MVAPQRVRPRRGRRLLAAAVGVGLAVAVAIGAAAGTPPQPCETHCYVNPVLAQDAPDPGLIHVGDHWYAVTTGASRAGAFPMYESPDLVHWTPHGNLFPAGHAPKWANRGYWAPEIHAVGDHYVAYFTARDRDGGKMRIGAATAPTVDGPYTDIGHPLVVNHHVGVIDPTFFRDGADQYVYWKEDGNSIGEPCRIMASRVSDDGTQLVGKAHEVLRNDPSSWEGTVVEAPEVVSRDGWYYLFYSGNSYADSRYAEGVARSRSPLGPFEKQGQPFLHSGESWSGPGHAAINGDWILYHAWQRGHERTAPGRELLLDRLHWSHGWPHVDGDRPGETSMKAP